MPERQRRSPRAAVDARPADSVDGLLASWRARRPDFAVDPVGVILRLGRLRAHLDRELRAVFQAHDIGPASFPVLVTLERLTGQGPVTQAQLMDALGLTSGTISVRMDRLVEQGLAERARDPASGRANAISLTAAGRALVDRVVPAHLANEQRLLSALSPHEQAQLAGLLRKLLIEFEGVEVAGDATSRLGLTLTGAHVTMATRASVGLPPRTGLLVRAVEPATPAERAGIRVADVLTRAGDCELRSITDLYTAIAQAASRGRLRIELQRHDKATRVTVSVTAPSTRPTTRGRAPRSEHRV